MGEGNARSPWAESSERPRNAQQLRRMDVCEFYRGFASSVMEKQRVTSHPNQRHILDHKYQSSADEFQLLELGSKSTFITILSVLFWLAIILSRSHRVILLIWNHINRSFRPETSPKILIIIKLYNYRFALKMYTANIAITSPWKLLRHDLPIFENHPIRSSIIHHFMYRFPASKPPFRITRHPKNHKIRRVSFFELKTCFCSESNDLVGSRRNAFLLFNRLLAVFRGWLRIDHFMEHVNYKEIQRII